MKIFRCLSKVLTYKQNSYDLIDLAEKYPITKNFHHKFHTNQLTRETLTRL